MKRITNFDRLNQGINEEKNMLLLHPRLIYGEKEKLERKTPVYYILENDEVCFAFMPRIPIEKGKSSGDMKLYLPSGTLMLLGGESKYVLKTRGTHISPTGDILENGYDVINRENGKAVFSSGSLPYFGMNCARLHNLIIMQNNIMYHDGECLHFTDSGYVLLEHKNQNINGGALYTLYDSKGDLACVDNNKERITIVGENAPRFVYPKLKKDTSLFESMIISSLKDRDGLQDMECDNLIDVSNYLQEIRRDLTINLDTLEVYRTDYRKYLSKKKKK